MSKNRKHTAQKQGFLQGAVILAVGTLLAKVIGALFKIPLARLITAEGAGHFNVAYNIYIVLLNISSTGLPIAVSRLISEANTLGQNRQMNQIHRVSSRLFLGIGIVSGLAMFLFAPQLAAWMRDPDAKFAIAALAPAVLFVCINSSFRGYFQGQQYMTPTATAQVLEALSKLLIGLAAAALALQAGLGYPQVAGAAILGVTIGSVLGWLYFLWQYRSRRIQLTPEDAGAAIPSAWSTTQKILKLAVPITIGATGLQIFNALGSKVILGRLQDAIGLSATAASAQFGIYSMAQTLYLLPSSLVQPLTISIIPAVTAALALKNHSEAGRTEESAIRMAGLIALPCGMGLSVLSAPIQQLLYGYNTQELSTAGPILTLLGISAILYCFILVTNAILQAHGKVVIPIFTTLAGGVVNILTTYLLVGNPDVHIYGAAIGNVFYCLTAIILNLVAIRTALPQPPRFFPQLIKSFCAAGLMAVTVYALYHLSSNVIFAVAGGVLVYFLLVYILKILTWHDCQLLPKGTVIAKLLRIKPPSEDQKP